MIADDVKSGAHAVLEAKPGVGGWEITVYDRDSTNVTKVDGSSIARTPRRLSAGSVIELGRNRVSTQQVAALPWRLSRSTRTWRLVGSRMV